jgi:hypothetical protein
MAPQMTNRDDEIESSDKNTNSEIQENAYRGALVCAVLTWLLAENNWIAQATRIRLQMAVL